MNFLRYIYRRHSLVMLIVWALVGFYIDRLKGMLVAGVVYMVVAPLIIFGVEKLFEFFKRKTKA